MFKMIMNYINVSENIDIAFAVISMFYEPMYEVFSCV